MAEPIRVLHVIAGMGSGGAESFLMNMCRHIDREKVQFDFLLRSNENIYAKELESMGCRVYYTASFPRHWLKNFLQTWRIIKQNHNKIIHVHANALLYVFPLIIAKKLNVPCRIMHSHNSSMAYKSALPIHHFFKSRINRIATHCFACSMQAGEWMFPGQYQIICNAIEVEKFRFDSMARDRIRAEWDLPEDAMVIGHVGRFWEQKNHAFLLHVFSKVLQQKPNAYLVLIGEGGLEQQIKDLVCKLGLSEHVIFAGVRKDVNKALSAFDVFAFPSIYEGLSVVVIEAQTNGLPLICSEATPKSVLFSPYSEQIPLDYGEDTWCQKLLSVGGHRCDVSNAIRQAGYDIRIEAKKLQDFYCEIGQRYRIVEEGRDEH